MTVQMDRPTDELGRAVRSKHLMEVAQLDYRRSIKHLEEQGRPQVEVARALGVAQPSLSSALKSARKVPEAVQGFSGAGPYEICQRFVVDQIDRARLVEELARWEYAPVPQPEWLEDVVPGPGPGSWDEVEDAVEDGLIDDGIYDEVQKRRFPQSA
ncbi:hypothetical protein [Brachybacterium alimentarium]|uniref:hypothetical protein n=2 Tax=Brachybacterium alimentarium TaxID=47845 RepID=UPI0011C069F1|nr:hypothetical protein [Brachybacterium alimentarium]